MSFSPNWKEPESIPEIRDIAQLGRAPALGAGGRRFKSYYPENSLSNNLRWGLIFIAINSIV